MTLCLPLIRARTKITSHFKRRCILPGYVTKMQQYLDIPALLRLAIQAPQHLKLRTYFCANPKGGSVDIFTSEEIKNWEEKIKKVKNEK